MRSGWDQLKPGKHMVVTQIDHLDNQVATYTGCPFKIIAKDFPFLLCVCLANDRRCVFDARSTVFKIVSPAYVRGWEMFEEEEDGDHAILRQAESEEEPVRCVNCNYILVQRQDRKTKAWYYFCERCNKKIGEPIT